jgi:3-oxoacyl-(acyl-carrier-protein) synthase
VKANIGHLEGASGLAGLIKTIKVLESAIIPPNANFEKLNPRIDAEFFNLKVNILFHRSKSRFLIDIDSFHLNVFLGHR